MVGDSPDRNWATFEHGTNGRAPVFRPFCIQVNPGMDKPVVSDPGMVARYTQARRPIEALLTVERPVLHGLMEILSRAPHRSSTSFSACVDLASCLIRKAPNIDISRSVRVAAG